MVDYPMGTMQSYPVKPVKRKHKRRNKYNAKKVQADGYTFDSKVEYLYYQRLKRLCVDFKYHESFEILPKFKLQGKTVRKCIYTPDFTKYNGGKLVSVVDVKGGKATETRASTLRMKMFMAKYQIPVYIATYDRKRDVFDETRK